MTLDRTSLGTWQRETNGTLDTIKSKALQDGTILVTHTWTFGGELAGSRETVKDAAGWQRQHDYLRDNGYTRVVAN